MLSWTIGDVTVKRIVELEMASAYSEKYPFIRQATPEELLKIDWLQPHFITPDGAIKWSVHALLVEAPGLKLVVDTCVGNDKDRPNHPFWNRLRADAYPSAGRRPRWSNPSAPATD